MTLAPVIEKGRAVRPVSLATHLQRIRDEERALLAQELHDELGALLMAAKLNLSGIRSRCQPMSADVERRFEHLADLLNDGVALKTRVVEGLHPSGLCRLGLVAALANLARDFARDTDIAVSTELEDTALDERSQLGAYRLVQECLTNVGKYAQATEVTIELLDGPGRVFVAVSDNGIGFERNDVAPFAQGLAGMQHRIEDIGGSLTVTSAPGEGTRVLALLPRWSSAHESQLETPASCIAGTGLRQVFRRSSSSA